MMRLMYLLNGNKKLRVFMELAGILLMLFLVLIPRTLQQGIKWTQFIHSLYLTFSKFIFVIALYIALLPSLLTSQKSVISLMLDTKCFNFIAKISFCTYLLHLNVVLGWMNSRTYSRYFTIVPTWTEYCAILIISLALGLIMTVLIEIPFMKMQKLLVNHLSKKLEGDAYSKRKEMKTGMN